MSYPDGAKALAHAAELGSQRPGKKEGIPRDAELPSESYIPGQPRPIGFIDNPSQDHLTASAEILERLAQEVSTGSGSSPIRVRFCQFLTHPTLAPNLFGFHAYEFDDNGEPSFDVDSVGGVAYAIVANLPVSLQAEVALASVLQLIYRQRHQNQMAEAGRPLHEIDIEMAKVDMEAIYDLKDRVQPLHNGWLSGADFVRRQAMALGFDVRARFSSDVIASPDDLRKRLPFLRRAYNENDVIRRSIDKIVSLIGRDEARVGGNVGSTHRGWAQQWNAAAHMRQFINQATRDGEVCGNGFLTFSEKPPIGAYNLRPEEVTISSQGFEARDKTFAKRRVVHVKGVEQVQSRYGISVLEPLIPTLVSLDTFRQARATAERFLAGSSTPDEVRDWAQGTLILADRMLDAHAATIESMLWFPEQHLPDAATDLYFPGREDL